MSPVRPVRWDRGTLILLDQTKLPEKERYLRCTSVDPVVRAIKTLAVRGAPLLGVTAAYALALAGDSLFALTEAARKLVASRPTAVNLKWAVQRVLRAVARSKDRRISRVALAQAKRIHAEDAAMCDAIGRHGAKLRLKRVLTICNTGALATGGIGTAFAVLVKSRPKIFACETRPLGQGARLTMWEARKYGLDATLIADGAAAATMREKKIDGVITGADRIAANGDTANKIGTYGLAILAREHGIPFYVAAPASTFDLSLRTGAQIPIEERPSAEVHPRFPAYNPAFDVTPARFITAFITDRGIIKPKDVKISTSCPS